MRHAWKTEESDSARSHTREFKNNTVSLYLTVRYLYLNRARARSRAGRVLIHRVRVITCGKTSAKLASRPGRIHLRPISALFLYLQPHQCHSSHPNSFLPGLSFPSTATTNPTLSSHRLIPPYQNNIRCPPRDPPPPTPVPPANRTLRTPSHRQVRSPRAHRQTPRRRLAREGRIGW
jgi:hypothetical protein